TGRTAPDDNPFPPPAGGTTTQPDDPFGPSRTTPPAEDTLPNPFGQPSSGTNPAGATIPTDTPAATDNPLPPRSPETQPTDSQPTLDNPFGPAPGTTGSSGSTPSDPFGAPSGGTPAAIDGASGTPMTNMQTTPTSETNGATPLDTRQPAPAIDDPFAEPAGGQRLSAAAAKSEPADSVRVWTDVTGKHQIRGRMKLILVDQQKVRILKETGKYTTVPFAKLSEADRQFVAHHAIEPSALLAENR
ncbi:MAG TPA: SHD1 domain-containing protein, partial [Pirellulales bacterium]|nr:SHD1 domain-containing protein [Pirellulales bacterium]